MATQVEYPTSDGKPMAETEVHRDLMLDLIETLKIHYADDPDVYVSGNILLFYEENNRKKHVAPDVLVTLGIPKLPKRLYYLLWAEGKAPNFIIELTSRTTRREDQRTKRDLYQDVLKVPEYFLFDPFQEYLKPSMQGYRLVDGVYTPIKPVSGRLPSAELGLHLERDGTQLRLFDPRARLWLPTPRELTEAAEARAEAETVARRRAEAEAKANAAKANAAEANANAAKANAEAETVARRRAEAQADAAKARADAARAKANAARAKANAETRARRQAEAEAERMRQEIEALRRRLGEPANPDDESAEAK